MRGWAEAALLLVVLLPACTKPPSFGGPGPETEAVLSVPLLRLISNPDTYHGRRVWTSGVLRIEFEGNALYVSHDHYRLRATQYAVWVSPDTQVLDAPTEALSSLNGWFVYIEGEFDAEHHGHGSRHTGGIRNVTQIRVLGR